THRNTSWRVLEIDADAGAGGWPGLNGVKPRLVHEPGLRSRSAPATQSAFLDFLLEIDADAGAGVRPLALVLVVNHVGRPVLLVGQGRHLPHLAGRRTD